MAQIILYFLCMFIINVITVAIIIIIIIILIVLRHKCNILLNNYKPRHGVNDCIFFALVQKAESARIDTFKYLEI